MKRFLTCFIKCLLEPNAVVSLLYSQPWSGEYIEFNGKGTYQCICCGADLFR